MRNPDFKNIIFDLGGVIIGLDTFKTIQAFSDLSKQPTDQVKQKFEASPFFMDYEKGNLTDEGFRNHVRSLLNIEESDTKIDKAWNAMLLEIPISKLDLLESLKSKYNTFLLSNTNGIHLREVNQILLRASQYKNLDSYFHKTYYSHLIGMRKPDLDIFNHVIEENNLIPAETIFVDDHEPNLSGAAGLGIQTKLITASVTILSLFS